MIIPIKCFTCGKVLADKWTYYVEACKKLEDETRQKGDSNVAKAPIFESLKLDRICCRRHMLGHVDLIDVI